MLGSMLPRWFGFCAALQANNDQQEYYLPDAVNQLKSVMAVDVELPGNTRYQ